MNYIALAALGLAVLAFFGVLLVMGGVAVVKATRRKPTAVVSQLAPAREIHAEPARYERPPERNFGDLALDWQEDVKRQKERAAAKANLEALFGIADVVAKSPGVAAPKE